MFNTSPFNAQQFNESFLPDLTRTYVYDKPYFLQLRTEAGVLVRRLSGWSPDARWRQNVNAADEIEVTWPLDDPDPQSGNIVKPNMIWLLDGSHKILQQFSIEDVTIDIKPGSRTFKLTAKGLLSQVFNQRATLAATGATTASVVAASIIALQSSTLKVTLGSIEGSIGDTAVDLEEMTNQSPYGMLQNLRKIAGGFFYIDSARALHWEKTSTSGGTNIISLPENLKEYSEEIQWGSLTNSVTVKGAVNFSTTPPVQVTSTAQTDSTSIAAYGTIVTFWFDKGVRTVAQANAVAAEILNQRKAPVIKRTLPIIDLSQIQQDPDNVVDRRPDYLHPGTVVRINPPSSIVGASVFSAQITSVERILGSPESVLVGFGEIKTVWDELAEKEKEQDEEDEADTPEAVDIIDWIELQDYATNTDLNSVEFVDLDDTPGTLGTEGQIAVIDSAGTAFEFTNFIAHTGANKAALGTPPLPALGLITTTGDNRLMLWDKDAADEGTPDTDDWRDVNSYGKAAT